MTPDQFMEKLNQAIPHIMSSMMVDFSKHLSAFFPEGKSTANEFDVFMCNVIGIFVAHMIQNFSEQMMKKKTQLKTINDETLKSVIDVTKHNLKLLGDEYNERVYM